MTKKSSLKYNKAWDNVKKTWVTPDEVDKCDRHDRNRFFTDIFNNNESIGSVLTVHKESREFINKNGTKVKRRAHFTVIANNTKEYREKTAKKIEKQESLVHKLSKEVIKELQFIRIPSVKANILGVDTEVLNEQYIKILDVNCTEKMDSDSRKIPDITLQVEILGKKQELLLEICYKHPVDENKKKCYRYYKMNCLEVDISALQDDLDASEKTLRKKLKNTISEEAYWISNRLQQLVEKDATDKYVVEISRKNTLLHSTIRKSYSLYDRLYTFKDEVTLAGIEKTHPCYFEENPNVKYTEKEKCINIGDCRDCNNCILINGYTSDDTTNTTIYCRKDGKNEKMHQVELINLIKEYAISLLEQESD